MEETRDMLVISKQNEVGVNVEEQINGSSLFFTEYCEAAKIVNSIVSDGRGSDFNNIVVFSGNRGTGKTSAMLNFGNVLAAINVYEQDPEREELCKKYGEIFKKFDEKVFSCKFMLFNKNVKEAIIDPSVIDGAHGLLDILIPRLYQLVKTITKDRSNKKNEEYCTCYDKLMSQFQKVYRELAIIESSSNAKETDVCGNMDRLNDLCAASDLQQDLRKLFELASKFVIGENGKSERTRECKKTGYFVLLIDDVDLGCENAYYVIEEIRKYLMIPHIVIIMATRIEQMEMCLRERNASYFKYMRTEDDIAFNIEMAQMPYKYLLKVIPVSRRIDLDYRNSKVTQIRKNYNEPEDLRNYVAQRFLYTANLKLSKDTQETIIPKNIRALINLVLFLEKLKEMSFDAFSKQGDYEIQKQNVNLIKQYIFSNTILDDELFVKYNKYIMHLFDENIKSMILITKQILSEGENGTTTPVYRSLNNSAQERQRIIGNSFIGFFNNPSCDSIDKKRLREFVALVFSIKYALEGVSENERASVIPKEYWEEIVEQKDLSLHQLVDTKLVLDKCSGENCKWLKYNQGNQNENKLIARHQDAKEGDYYKLLELLLFSDLTQFDKKILSNTTSSFINKTIYIDFAQFLYNIGSINEFISKTGIKLINVPDDRKNIFSKDIYQFEQDYSAIERVVKSIYKTPMLMQEMDIRIKNGRGYKEGTNVIRGKCKRIFKEIFEPLLSNDDEKIIENQFDKMSEMYQSIDDASIVLKGNKETKANVPNKKRGSLYKMREDLTPSKTGCKRILTNADKKITEVINKCNDNQLKTRLIEARERIRTLRGIMNELKEENIINNEDLNEEFRQTAKKVNELYGEAFTHGVL